MIAVLYRNTAYWMDPRPLVADIKEVPFKVAAVTCACHGHEWWLHDVHKRGLTLLTWQA